MQAGGRLVEDVKRAPGGAARQFLRQLDALRLAADSVVACWPMLI